ARVFAFLLLAEPPHQDFYSIQEFLSASKSSISNSLNKLMTEGVVDYMTFSGDRKRYFRISAQGWLKATHERIQKTPMVRKVFQEVLEFRQDSAYPELNERIENLIEFLLFMSEEIDGIMARWKARKEKD
ncbi:MAG: hypothetical protein KDC44_16805, partial [Phaeodactylibacter sp.]|nr:hypothetical protein [Phaeodactylibacter sp.]